MSQEQSPFLLLLIATVLSLAGFRKAALILIAVAVGRAFSLGIIAPVALAPLAALALLAWKFSQGPKPLQWLKLGAALVLAGGLLAHLFPGFHPLHIYEQIRFTPDARPFSMDLNFDKAMAGALLLALLVRPAQWAPFSREDLRIALLTLAGLVAAILPIALGIGYLRFSPKPIDTLWALNNLAFVCVAEEAIFRGLLQNRLMLLRPGSDAWRWICVVIAATAFGLAHFAGGPAYVGLATLAGIGYGFVYLRTRKIEAPILVHFGFNLVHFVFFTYPALAPV